MRLRNPGEGTIVECSGALADKLIAKGWLQLDEREPDAHSTGETEREPETAHSAVPSRTASRKAWAEYAQSLGIDPGDMTRAELITATGN